MTSTVGAERSLGGAVKPRFCVAKKPRGHWHNQEFMEPISAMATSIFTFH